MKAIAQVIFAMAATLACCPAAQAGNQYYGEVAINPPARAASGALNAARRSQDPRAEIGCAVQYGFPQSQYPYPTEKQVYATCRALTSQARLDCISLDPIFIDMVRAISPSSLVTFVADENGLCVRMTVDNSSSHLP